ncbi:radical SAM protein [Thermosyntropha sp.]|uniref:radical SAM protein n=1 Tax=Thermosyntropha sp. TaxID=2740820 RepID=UPI0026010BB9|nr:radical SAM protein [Thermosyntropha sp.]MBO8159611.1 radical SAM protein [Thermosyntropha sp.]
MKSAKQLVSTVVLREGLNYVEKNPMQNLNKLINWGEKLAVKENHKEYARNFRRILNEPENNWRTFVERLFVELDPHVRKKLLENFVVNSGLAGMPLAEKIGAKHGCSIPWAILMDPTAACNLKCIGCWAAEYEKTSSLDYETLNRIIEEGKELGIYMYIYSGGEPLIRKKDLLKLARKHNDCMFLSFTNGTLVDEDFAREMQKLGNFSLAISVEGFEEETDMRRGKGTFRKVMETMDILKKYGVPFGFSTCYHSQNTTAVGSDEYIDLMIEKGCIFGWYFTYIPLGKDAKLELLASPEQREWMFYRVREFRETKPIFLMDFWNDGEFTEGCIAGGRKYLHINANGDVEPCAFIHYSNVNIKDVSLLDALKCDLFRQYQSRQPFNENHLRPCPLLDNPHQLREMVQQSGARSTQLMDLEPVEVLTDKCIEISQKWAVNADRLWQEVQSQKECSNCSGDCSKVG